MRDQPTTTAEPGPEPQAVLSRPGLPRRGLLGGAGLALGAAAIAPDGRDHVPDRPGGGPADRHRAAGAAGAATAADRQRDAPPRRRGPRGLRAQVGETPVAPHPDNGDEARYPNKIGSDTRGLPHNARGEVDPAAWQALHNACQSGDPADFEKIPLGGTRRLVNPVGTLAVSLSGITPTQIAIPPAPALASAERAGEAVEVYWQALLRDVPFAEFRDGTDNRDVLAACEELSRLSDFRGPKAEGRVTPGTLFRGSALYFDTAYPNGRSVTPPGVLDGPVISQFLLRDVPYGAQWIGARMRTAAPDSEFLTGWDEWLATQNGEPPRRPMRFDPTPRYIATGRDLAEYVRAGPALHWAASLLLATPAGGPDPRYAGLYPLAQPALYPSNPYRRSPRTRAAASATFGLAHVQALLAEGVTNAVRACLLAEVLRAPHAAAGGLWRAGASAPGQRGDRLPAARRVPAVGGARAKQGEARHPPAVANLPRRPPPFTRPTPAARRAVGAVTATLLKAFFDESRVIADPVQPDPSDPTKLVPYKGRR